MAGGPSRSSLLVLVVPLLIIVTLVVGGCSPADEDGATTTAPVVQTTVAPGTATTSGPPPTSAPGAQTESARLSPEEGPFSACQDCHAFLDPPGQIPATLKENFSHESHLGYEDVACESCHRLPVHTSQGTRKPLMADCFTCHGQEEDARASGECELCHPEDLPLVPTSHTQEFIEAGHPQTAQEQGREQCVICHEGTTETVCSECHGVELPHPEGWTGTGDQPGDHVNATHQDPGSCVPCHDNRTDVPGGCFGGECHGD